MYCNCQCNGKCKLLGCLEQQIMDILWSQPTPLKPRQVKQLLKNKYAYTTIMTVLKRMADKKLLSRQLKGNVYLYQPLQDKATFAAHSLNDLFQRLFSSYGDHVTLAFKTAAQKAKIKI